MFILANYILDLRKLNLSKKNNTAQKSLTEIVKSYIISYLLLCLFKKWRFDHDVSSTSETL